MIVVIGHYPAYRDLARARGCLHFQVDVTLWESWTQAQQWAANRAFLDDASNVGAVYLLATPPAAARPGSWYRRELDYLLAKGYQARLNGVEWELFR